MIRWNVQISAMLDSRQWVGRLTPGDLKVIEREIGVIIVRLSGSFPVTKIGIKGRSVSWRGYLSCRHWELSLVFSIPAIDGEMRTLWVGSRVQVHRKGYCWLW